MPGSALEPGPSGRPKPFLWEPGPASPAPKGPTEHPHPHQTLGGQPPGLLAASVGQLCRLCPGSSSCMQGPGPPGPAPRVATPPAARNAIWTDLRAGSSCRDEYVHPMASRSLGAQGCRTRDGPPGRKPPLSARAHGRLSESPRAPACLRPRKPENSATSGSSSRERLGRETEPPMIPCGGAHPSPSSVWTQGRRGPLQPHSVSLETVHQSPSPHTSPPPFKKRRKEVLGAKLSRAGRLLPGLGAYSTRPGSRGARDSGGGGEGVLGAVGQTALPLRPRMGQTPGPSPPPGPREPTAVRGGGDGTESLGWTHVPPPDSFGSRPRQCAKPF